MKTIESIVVESKEGGRWRHNFYFKNAKGDWIRQSGLPCSGRYKHQIVKMMSKDERDVISYTPLKRNDVDYEEQLYNHMSNAFSKDVNIEEEMSYYTEYHQAIEVIECRTKQWVEKSEKMEITKTRKF